MVISGIFLNFKIKVKKDEQIIFYCINLVSVFIVLNLILIIFDNSHI